MPELRSESAVGCGREGVLERAVGVAGDGGRMGDQRHSAAQFEMQCEMMVGRLSPTKCV